MEVVEAATNAELERLSAGPYVSLTTFRRDGTPVATPVWVSRDADRLYVWTDGGSGKVKRLRAGGRVLLAPCDARGRAQGSSVEGTAVVLEDRTDVDHVRVLHRAKYGLQFRAFDLGASLFRRRIVAVAISVP